MTSPIRLLAQCCRSYCRGCCDDDGFDYDCQPNILRQHLPQRRSKNQVSSCRLEKKALYQGKEAEGRRRQDPILDPIHQKTSHHDGVEVG